MEVTDGTHGDVPDTDGQVASTQSMSMEDDATSLHAADAAQAADSSDTSATVLCRVKIESLPKSGNGAVRSTSLTTITCCFTSCGLLISSLSPLTGVQCLPQRSALLKSILNFFKKVIPEPTLSFADSISHMMEGSMPKALQHIISNAEYYGASLFLLGTALSLFLHSLRILRPSLRCTQGTK